MGNVETYASGVVDAREARRVGNVERALRIEMCLDEIYKSFPEEVRW